MAFSRDMPGIGGPPGGIEILRQLRFFATLRHSRVWRTRICLLSGSGSIQEGRYVSPTAKRVKLLRLVTFSPHFSTAPRRRSRSSGSKSGGIEMRPVAHDLYPLEAESGNSFDRFFQGKFHEGIGTVSENHVILRSHHFLFARRFSAVPVAEAGPGR